MMKTDLLTTDQLRARVEKLYIEHIKLCQDNFLYFVKLNNYNSLNVNNSGASGIIGISSDTGSNFVKDLNNDLIACGYFNVANSANAIIKIDSNLNKINVPLPPDNCSDGISAMLIAWNYYESEDKTKYEKDMQDCIYYNSLDCEYLDVLLTFARDNL